MSAVMETKPVTGDDGTCARGDSDACCAACAAHERARAEAFSGDAESSYNFV